jgi:hypothetical protein
VQARYRFHQILWQPQPEPHTCACARVAYLSRTPSAFTVLYCHLWPFWLQQSFKIYLINDTIFRKQLLDIKCVFWFSLQLLSKAFFIIRKIQRYIVIIVKTSVRNILEKTQNIKLHQNPSSGSPVVPRGRTDGRTKRQTDMMKLIVAFRKFAKTAK